MEKIQVRRKKRENKSLYLGNNIGKVIDKYKKKGIWPGVTHMADMTGINERTIYFYIQNKTEPTAANLLLIAEYLDVSPYDLIRIKKVK